MDNSIFIRHAVDDRSYTAFIKREIHSKITNEHFGEARIGEIDIIISELTSNLIKHAKGGELLYRITHEKNEPVLEIVCIDSGGGIANLPYVMKDGISTTRTLGQGLGAIQRLSDLFQVYSLTNWGTIMYVKVSAAESTFVSPRKKNVDVKALCTPKPGEEVSGDGYCIKQKANETHIFMGDALGHGKEAHKVINQAINSFKSCVENDPIEILRYIHNELRRTRGLVGTVAILDHKNHTWRMCGVGNILTRTYGGLIHKNFMPYNGILGLNIPNTMKNNESPVENNQYLIMCSDGIRSRWDFTKYPGLFKYDSTLLAAILYKDFSRRNDDTSVLIGKVSF